MTNTTWAGALLEAERTLRLAGEAFEFKRFGEGFRLMREHTGHVADAIRFARTEAFTQDSIRQLQKAYRPNQSKGFPVA